MSAGDIVTGLLLSGARLVVLGLDPSSQHKVQFNAFSGEAPASQWDEP